MNTNTRNSSVDIIRGFAMLLVVLGHTLSGTVTEYSGSLLFQIIWTLQIPLFIIISGYVTRFSRPMVGRTGLWAFIKKRSLAYLLPWTVWTILVRGLIFGQAEFLNLKHLIWHMDSGYWFLVTIWTISMIFGISDYLSNKWFKKNQKINVLCHFVICGIGLVGLAAVGYFAGLNFFAIKLPLYYLPIYLLGYLYGKVQDWLMAKANAETIVNCAIVVSLGLWLAIINRFDFYASGDGGIMIIGRFITSIIGCVAVIGLISASCAMYGRYSFTGSLPHPLPVSGTGSNTGDATLVVNGGAALSCNILSCNDGIGSNNHKGGQSNNNELSAVRKTKIEGFLNWVGIHSLEVYLIHGFSLCVLRYSSFPVLHSVSGWGLVMLNFVIAVSLSFIYIRIIEKSALLNKILFWK